MKHIIVILCVGGLLGCTASQQTTDTSNPQLLYQHPLPEFPQSKTVPPMKMELAFLIGEDGSVLDARLANSSGNTEWDSSAIGALRQWKFFPVRQNNKPIRRWIHLDATIKYDSPINFYLAEILCPTVEQADSIFQVLTLGQNFGELASKLSLAPSREKNGVLGEVNIYCYPEGIRKHLTKLGKEEITEPIQYGDNFVIFKRLSE
jgi:TonB family protein